MVDFVNKIITIILIFVMLVLSVMVWVNVRSEMISDRVVLDEMALFIDKVTDKRIITEQDLDELYLAINASGGIYDVVVTRLVKVTTMNEDGTLRNVYFSANEHEQMNSGDIIKVTVKRLGLTPERRIVWTLLKLDLGHDSFTLSGTVR